MVHGIVNKYKQITNINLLKLNNLRYLRAIIDLPYDETYFHSSSSCFRYIVF